MGARGSLVAQLEAPRVVRKLSFVGNKALDDYTLLAAIATTPSSYFATAGWLRWIGLGEKRYFDELEFRRDVVRLILLYRQSGFMNVVVDTTVRRTAKDAFVMFRIFEGEPVRVTNIDISGVAGILNERALRRALPLQVGDPFNRFLFQASADTLTAWLRNRGHPYAVVLRNFDSDVGGLTAQLQFAAVPGPDTRIGSVVVRGVERLDTATVLRTISIRPGDRFREDLLYRSQRDLYGLGLFRSASVTLMDSLPPGTSGTSDDGAADPAGDSLVRVLVQVVEGPRHRIRFGAGYGSLDCFRFQSGWSAYNFFGGARVLDLSARLSKIGVGYPLNAGMYRTLCHGLQKDSINSDTLNYNVGVTLYQPTFLSPAHTASIGVFAERRSEFKTYTRTQVGTNLGVTLNARSRVPVNVSYGYSVGRTIAVPGVLCSVFTVCTDSAQSFLAQRRPFASLTLNAALRTENFALDPTTGGHVGLTLLHSSRLLGSDRLYEFNRGELEIAHYYQLSRRSVLAWRVRSGALLPTRLTISGQRVNFVPPEQRFYAGGPNSVRGYGANELGPVVYVISDSTSGGYKVVNGDTVYTTARSVATGGNSIFLLNGELRLPGPIWPDQLRVALFVDAGQVYERENELFAIKGMRVTPGVGLRLTTPLGPVRVDVAYNGYDLAVGKLVYQDSTALVDMHRVYQQRAPSGFGRRLVFQFAIGQAF